MIIIFCGIPGAGKSTIAKRLVKKLQKFGKTCKIFVSDKVGSKVYQKALDFLKKNRGKFDFLIFDATFYKRGWREIIQKEAGSEKVFIIYLYCPLEICLERNRKRKPQIPEKAVHIIFHQMEIPENPDISIDTEKIKPKEAVELILKRMGAFNLEAQHSLKSYGPYFWDKS